MAAYLTESPIDLGPLIARVSGPGQGGVASFVGLVRDHQDGRAVTRLEYSAYPPMAEAELARIISEAERRWPARVVVRHRIGTLAIGEVAVAVVAASAHRAPAFEACRYVIEELKHRVPVWKKECYADGAVCWVDPTGQGGARPEAVPS